MSRYHSFDTGLLIQHECSNLGLAYARPKKSEVKLIGESFFDKNGCKWEPRWDNGYPNIIFDKHLGIYRIYFTLFIKDEASADTPLEDRLHTKYLPSDDRVCGLGLLESKDGINWVRPICSQVEFEGSYDNNLLLKYCHGAGVMLDETDPDPHRRYKLVATFDNEHRMATCFSEDGIHFSDPVFWNVNPVGDTCNYIFKDTKDNTYKCISRLWKGSLRVACLCVSDDCITWSEPVEIARGEGAANQIYSMPTIQLDSYYLGFASIFHDADQTDDNFDTVDLDLRYSYDMHYFDKCVQDQVYLHTGEGIYPGGAIDSGVIFSATPIEIDGVDYLYYMAGNGCHTSFRETSLTRCVLPHNRWTYFYPKDQGSAAHLVSTALRFVGNKVYLDVDVQPEWEIDACVYDISQIGLSEKPSLHKAEVTLKDRTCVLVFDSELAMDSQTSWCLDLKFRGMKIYSVSGDIEICSNKY